MAFSSVRVLIVAVAVGGVLAGSGCSSSDKTTAPPAPVIAMTATTSGDGQTAQVGTALPNPLRVVVTVSGAPQAGTTVTWSAQGTGASVAPTASLTDANGVATTTWTLGTTAAAQTAMATLAGATGSPVTFTATASAAPVPIVAMMASASGNGQTDTVHATLANPLRVVVTLSGVPVAGDTITWGTVNAGASVGSPKSVTDASGIATTTWTLGTTAGAQSVTATLAGATGSPVTFGATATAGAATQIALVSGNNQTAQTGVAFGAPLIVKISDQFGNGIGGDTVAWASLHGVVTVAPAKSASAASGQAQTLLTALGVAGVDTVTAASGTLTGSPLRFAVAVTTAPLNDTVTVGSGISFTSRRNGSVNPAVDTIAVGGTVTWVWAGGDHGVGSTGSPSFTSQSSAQTSGTYAITFNSAGTYTYDCIVHGTAMSGRIVVR